jgi:hypothetical protein
VDYAEDRKETKCETTYTEKKNGIGWQVYGQPWKARKLYAEFYPLTLENHFSIPKSQLRTVPYKLSFPLSYEHSIRVNLPESWSIKPDSKSIETAYYKYDYNASYDADNKALILKTIYKAKSDHIPVSAMSALSRAKYT